MEQRAPDVPGKPFLDTLSGSDRRSLGRSEEVIAQILDMPAQFGELIDAMLHPDPVIRSRAAHCADQITAQRPMLLLPVIEKLTQTGTPAMRARGRKLLKRLRPKP